MEGHRLAASRLQAASVVATLMHSWGYWLGTGSEPEETTAKLAPDPVAHRLRFQLRPSLLWDGGDAIGQCSEKLLDFFATSVVPGLPDS